MELESLCLKGRYNWVSSAYKFKDTPYFKKMEPNGSRYKENNVGARIDPWGTPQDTCCHGRSLGSPPEVAKHIHTTWTLS